MDLSQKIHSEHSKIADSDPWKEIAVIGREYMSYCLNNKVKAKLILGYDEMNYIDEFREWVEEIWTYSNQFELTPYIKKIIMKASVKSQKVSMESIALYLWAEAQGMATLIMKQKGMDTRLLQSRRERINKGNIWSYPRKYWRIENEKMMLIIIDYFILCGISFHITGRYIPAKAI